MERLADKTKATKRINARAVITKLGNIKKNIFI